MTKCHSLLALLAAFYFTGAWISIDFSQPCSSSTWWKRHGGRSIHRCSARQGIFKKVWFQIGSLLRLQKSVAKTNRTLSRFFENRKRWTVWPSNFRKLVCLGRDHAFCCSKRIFADKVSRKLSAFTTPFWRSSASKVRPFQPTDSFWVQNPRTKCECQRSTPDLEKFMALGIASRFFWNPWRSLKLWSLVTLRNEIPHKFMGCFRHFLLSTTSPSLQHHSPGPSFTIRRRKLSQSWKRRQHQKTWQKKRRDF